MKATSILSALVFAHAAFAQATDSTSAAVSTSAAGSTSTVAAPSTSAAPSASVVETSTLASASSSGTKSSTRSETRSNVAGTTTPGAPAPSPTDTTTPTSGSQGSSNDTPLIPSGISAGCSTFLKTLNDDTQLSACLTPLLNAVSAYGPSYGSASGLPKALNNLCSSNACSQSAMSAKLNEYKDSCADELTGANQNQLVIQDYDVLYSLIPFKDAMCSKSDSQVYCLLDPGTGPSAANSTSASVTYAANHLANSISGQGSQSVLVPNTDAYQNSNIMYLFASPLMNATDLCTSCTKQVLAKYFAFQTAVPHALGLKNSPLLGGQNKLFSQIKEQCPSNFVDDISQIANVETPKDINSGALPAYTGSILTALAGALAAVVALV